MKKNKLYGKPEVWKMFFGVMLGASIAVGVDALMETPVEMAKIIVCFVIAGASIWGLIKAEKNRKELAKRAEEEAALMAAPVVAEPTETPEVAEPTETPEVAEPTETPVVPAVDYDSLEPEDLDAFDRAERDKKLRLIKLGRERLQFKADSAKLDAAKEAQAELIAEGEKAVE